MAKYFGNAVKTGKLGVSVFAVRYGEVIERQYQPVVANPSTPAQVESRAKLKMLSQLSETMSDAIAFRRQGAVSARNLFVKNNYRKTTYSSNQAQLPMSDVDLTGGILFLPTPTATRNQATVNLSMPANQALEVDRVVYAVYEYGRDGIIVPRGVKVVTTPGDDNTFATTATLTGTSAIGFVIAYGIRDNTEAARTYFGDLNFDNVSSIAKLLTSSSLLENDITLTMTTYSAISAS